MKRRLNIAFAALCALVAFGARAEVVGTKEKTFAVKYKDDAVERYTVAWTANLTTTLKEQGGSPIPYQGSTDIRRCEWTIATTIDRTVSLATRLGPSFPLPGMSKTYKEDFQNRGGELVVTGSRNESCKDATAQREAAIASAKGNARGLLERLSEADLEILKQESRSKADVVSITVQ